MAAQYTNIDIVRCTLAQYRQLLNGETVNGHTMDKTKYVYVVEPEQNGVSVEVSTISNATIDSLFGYAITTTVTNGSVTGDTFITFSGTASLVITPNSGYYLPESVTVTGASYTYDKVGGMLSLSNPTGSISISVICDDTLRGYQLTLTSAYPIMGGGYEDVYVKLNSAPSNANDYDYRTDSNSNDDTIVNTNGVAQTTPIIISNVAIIYVWKSDAYSGSIDFNGETIEAGEFSNYATISVQQDSTLMIEGEIYD